jgi:hypothetical protein
MKAIFNMFLALAMFGCATNGGQGPDNLYSQDFKTVFQASLSSLKDRDFTIKAYDWNSGEIDAYRQYKDDEKLKVMVATVSLEDMSGKVKVRINLKARDDSAPIPKSEFRSAETGFFVALKRSLPNQPSK